MAEGFFTLQAVTALEDYYTQFDLDEDDWAYVQRSSMFTLLRYYFLSFPIKEWAASTPGVASYSAAVSGGNAIGSGSARGTAESSTRGSGDGGEGAIESSGEGGGAGGSGGAGGGGEGGGVSTGPAHPVRPKKGMHFVGARQIAVPTPTY